MKKILISFALLAMLSSCANNTSNNQNQENANANQNQEILENNQALENASNVSNSDISTDTNVESGIENVISLMQESIEKQSPEIMLDAQKAMVATLKNVKDENQYIDLMGKYLTYVFTFDEAQLTNIESKFSQAQIEQSKALAQEMNEITKGLEEKVKNNPEAAAKLLQIIMQQDTK